MSLREKKIRFPLVMKNGAEVRNLKELQDNFDLDTVLDYYRNGRLMEWLKLWRLFDEAELLSKLDRKDVDLKHKICDIFGMEYREIPKIVDPKETAWRAGRLNLLKKFTDDPKYLEKVDNVAFNVDDVYDLLDDGVHDIYLCGKLFAFPAEIFRGGNQSYHGIGKVMVKIESTQVIEFEELNITFEDVEFDEEYLRILFRAACRKFKEIHSERQSMRQPKQK